MTSTLLSIMQMPADKRYTHLLAQAKTTQLLWILTDEHGCVMLNTEDEDCVPVWPSQDYAQYWATGDWADCKAQSIGVNEWLERWTTGLEGDELLVVACPNPDEPGLVLEPDMFDEDLRR
ncbi:DUF2750 domain-containing protein [Glaciecola siphonariae]|uniref:DUF2750 domain-containing protein n=1 Tax=Glaciecola siphonariae TaxID=521012 RepID=A0ABV9M084_9ALTE